MLSFRYLLDLRKLQEPVHHVREGIKSLSLNIEIFILQNLSLDLSLVNGTHSMTKNSDAALSS